MPSDQPQHEQRTPLGTSDAPRSRQRLWTRFAGTWTDLWPIAYLAAFLWFVIAVNRRSPWDFAVIGMWVLFGTVGLVGRLLQNRRDRS